MSDDSSHAHSGHAEHDHDAASSHGHGDDAPKFPFGEVIPEKNWQENVVVFCAVICLAGLVWLFAQWVSTPLAVADEQEHAAQPAGAGKTETQAPTR